MSKARVGLIWAQTENGVIGNEGTMPWYLPEDLAHFKAVTLGWPVVMGRKTWESLPARFRPLPGRRNIVITRQADWLAPGAEVAHSVTDAIELAAASDQPDFIWVIGGGQVFDAVIGTADRLEVTQIQDRADGDTIAPEIGERWRVSGTEPEDGWHESKTGLAYRFVTYEAR